MLPLLRADPHRWGMGHVHRIDEGRDKTLCGQGPATCPGTKYYGPAKEITCKACLASIEAKARYERFSEQRAEEVAAEAQRRAAWWTAYDDYLTSVEWLGKRRRVMQRAGGVCEACGLEPASQVHHLRYPRDCMPGSAEWIAREKLFDLRAICPACHDDVHR